MVPAPTREEHTVAVLEYKTKRTVVETRQLVIDDAAFISDHGCSVAKASPAVLKNELLARGLLEEGVIIASESDGIIMPTFPTAVTPEQVGYVTWRLDGIIYGDEIALLSVQRADPVPGVIAAGGVISRWDEIIDGRPGTEFNGPWADTIEVPVDATEDEVWAAARAAADEHLAAMAAAENKESTR